MTGSATRPLTAAWQAVRARAATARGPDRAISPPPFQMCSKTSSAISWAAAWRRPQPRQPRRRPALQPENQSRRGLFGSDQADHRALLRGLLGLRRLRLRGWRRTHHLPHLFGHGQGSRATGLFHGPSAPAPPVRASVRSSRTPCRTCGGAGRQQKDRAAVREHPPRASRPAPASASRRGRGRPARRACGRPLHLPRGRRPPAVPA